MRSFLTYFLILSTVAQGAPVPHTPVKKPVARTQPLEIEAKIPSEKDLPSGVQKRFFLEQMPEQVFCGPGVDETRVLMGQRYIARRAKRGAGGNAGAPNFGGGVEVPGASAHGGRSLWELSPGGGKDPHDEVLQKYRPFRVLQLTPNRATAVLAGRETGSGVLEMKDGTFVASDKADKKDRFDTVLMSSTGSYAARHLPTVDENGFPSGKQKIFLTELSAGVRRSFETSALEFVTAVAPDGQSVLGLKEGISYLVGRDGKVIPFGGPKETISPQLSSLVGSPDGKLVVITTEEEGDPIVRRVHIAKLPKYTVERSFTLAPNQRFEPDGLSADGTLVLGRLSEAPAPGGNAPVVRVRGAEKAAALHGATGEVVAEEEGARWFPCSEDGNRWAVGRYVKDEDGGHVELDIVQPQQWALEEAGSFSTGRLETYAQKIGSLDAQEAYSAARSLQMGNVRLDEALQLRKKVGVPALTKDDRDLLTNLRKKLEAPKEADRNAAVERIEKLLAGRLQAKDRAAILEAAMGVYGSDDKGAVKLAERLAGKSSPVANDEADDDLVRRRLSVLKR